MRALKSAFTLSIVLCTLLLLGAGEAMSDTNAENSTQQITDAEQTYTSTDKTEETLPLWDLNLALVGARLPHYAGSDEYENYFYPLPYIVYRGDFLRADRNSVRGIFYKGNKFEVSLSLWGNPPVDEDNKARQGMTELEAVAEIGPALRYYIHRNRGLDQLYLQAAVRSAWSIDFQGGLDIVLDYQGWHGGLDLRYQNSSLFEAHNLRFNVTAGLHFADNRYHHYFYGVEDQFATADRSRYDGDGGYAGFAVSTGLYKKITKNLGTGLYVRWRNIDGAVFEDSPLVREKNNYAIGASLVWTFLTSDRPAPK